MNVLNGIPKRACTSCQMCGAICPKGAITISIDDEGFYRPLIDDTLCVNCNLCTKVCYKYDDSIITTNTAQIGNLKLYAAAAKDDVIVRQTTSGGIADLLAQALIGRGYTVVGVAYNSKLNIAMHEAADTISGTKKFRGSKYIQSYSVDAFHKLVKSCRNKKFAVFGLPCEIYSISRYLDLIKCRENCILIDLYCHGCPSMFAWNKVSDSVKKELHVSNFETVNWRSKYRGWGNFVLEIHGDNGKVFRSSPMRNEFFDFFFCNQLLNESCVDCKLRGTLAYTDIRLGDFWGKEYDKTFRGVSGVSVITSRGESIFKDISKDINSKEKDFSCFLPYQSWDHVYKVNPVYRKQLMQLLQDNDTTLTQCYTPIKKRQGLSEKIMRLVKQVLYYMPEALEKNIRKIIK